MRSLSGLHERKAGNANSGGEVVSVVLHIGRVYKPLRDSWIEGKVPAPYVADAHEQVLVKGASGLPKQLDAKPKLSCTRAVQSTGETLDSVFLNL
jgi:hypothetical protein